MHIQCSEESLELIALPVALTMERKWKVRVLCVLLVLMLKTSGAQTFTNCRYSYDVDNARFLGMCGRLLSSSSEVSGCYWFRHIADTQGGEMIAFVGEVDNKTTSTGNGVTRTALCSIEYPMEHWNESDVYTVRFTPDWVQHNAVYMPPPTVTSTTSITSLTSMITSILSTSTTATATTTTATVATTPTATTTVTVTTRTTAAGVTNATRTGPGQRHLNGQTPGAGPSGQGGSVADRTSPKGWIFIVVGCIVVAVIVFFVIGTVFFIKRKRDKTHRKALEHIEPTLQPSTSSSSSQQQEFQQHNASGLQHSNVTLRRSDHPGSIFGTPIVKDNAITSPTYSINPPA